MIALLENHPEVREELFGRLTVIHVQKVRYKLEGLIRQG